MGSRFRLLGCCLFLVGLEPWRKPLPSTGPWKVLRVLVLLHLCNEDAADISRAWQRCADCKGAHRVSGYLGSSNAALWARPPPGLAAP